jgi:hypothetical protein
VVGASSAFVDALHDDDDDDDGIKSHLIHREFESASMLTGKIQEI